MDAILSRVGDAELRQHCVAAVLDELQQADTQVKHVVAALQRTLNVVQASRDVHKTLVLTTSEQVQASFRQVGESCNQIGPLLRLLHQYMSAMSSTTPGQSATVTTEATAPSNSATSACDVLSDDSEVVEVTPPQSTRKRKTTVELSASVRKMTRLDDRESVQRHLTEALRDLRATSKASYTVAMHKDLSSFIKRIFIAKVIDKWRPRDDPLVAQLLAEMDKRMSAFKDNATQIHRRKTIKEWQQQLAALSFVSSLDLTSLPPKIDPRAAEVHACETGQDARVLSKRVVQLANTLRADRSSGKKKRKKYLKPLVNASIEYFAALHELKSPETDANEVIECMGKFHLVCTLVQCTTITRDECVHLEQGLYLLRLILAKSSKVRKKAVKLNLIPDVLALFPPSTRPEFNYPLEAKNEKEKTKKKVKK